MVDAARFDRLGAALVLAGSLGLLAAWPGWRVSEVSERDAYAQSPEIFLQAAEAFAAAHGGEPVRPPPGADIPVIARRFEFWPPLELKAGETYRLHVASTDTVHTVVVQGRELSLVPGQVRVVEITPKAGELPLQCGEYCGLGHNRMGTGVRVTE
jgi:cytochrome c oxidase subunit 2